MNENERIVERLRVALEEVGTPVLEIWDDILALPIVGILDTQRSAQMSERLLAEVTARKAKFVIVDLTGVDVVDTSTADRIIKLTRSVALLGADCMLSGIQPAVARTLIDLGVDFMGISTERNLRRALQACMAKRTAAMEATS